MSEAASEHSIPDFRHPMWYLTSKRRLRGLWTNARDHPREPRERYFSDRSSRSFDARKTHLAGAAFFAFFALDTVLGLMRGFSIREMLVAEVTAVVS